MKHLLERISMELGKVLGNGIPEGFNHITISPDGRKKPIILHHSLRIIGFTGEPPGIVLAYSAGPDNIHDKAVFHALNDSGIFRSYKKSMFGLRGATFQRYFAPDRQVIIRELELIFECIGERVKWEECDVLVSCSTGKSIKLKGNTLE